jgi:hypothetical protein
LATTVIRNVAAAVELARSQRQPEPPGEIVEPAGSDRAAEVDQRAVGVQQHRVNWCPARRLGRFDNHRRLRELITELEALSLAITENDPRWNR